MVKFRQLARNSARDAGERAMLHGATHRFYSMTCRQNVVYFHDTFNFIILTFTLAFIMKTILCFFLLAFIALPSIAAAPRRDASVIEKPVTLRTSTGNIYGTLTLPRTGKKFPVALIIAGSGPTDRNGNNQMMKNNSLKLLAAELSKAGIAVLRYDKRGIGESKAAGKIEADLRFEDYVNDAKAWVQLLKHDKHFTQCIVIGHSEGSLIGMLAADSADKFISIAGPGESADQLIKTQLKPQAKQVQDLCYPILDSLKSGKTVENVPPMLNAFFRLSVQPYLISWFKYDPQREIKKLSIPVMILQGTNDLQVTVEDANRLSRAKPDARLIFIDNMNHIFRVVAVDNSANAATYNNASLPISSNLISRITTFIAGK
jgi:uncharacterized protein